MIEEIKTMRQHPEEDAGSYGIRVRILHNCLINIYDTDQSLENEYRNLFKGKADSDVSK